MLVGRPAADRLISRFHLTFIALALTAALVKRPRVHEALALLMTVLFAAYIALLFARL